MEVDIAEGKYVVAVSGGVDSVTLLDLLAKQRETNPKLDLIVAHFDHGIRKDSKLDKKLVNDLAKKYKLAFFFKEGNLGPMASEETSRDKRYEFLWEVVKKSKANGLITAHHQDDLIESAIINIIRGTGRRGLSSMMNPKIIRPLLNVSKHQVIEYAKQNKLSWREDSTNQDPKYLRNYVRLNIVPKLTDDNKRRILKIINNQARVNKDMDKDLETIMKSVKQSNNLPRLWFNSLDHKSACEILAYWLKQNGLANYDRATIDRLVSMIKSSKTGKSIDIFSGSSIEVKKDYLALTTPER